MNRTFVMEIYTNYYPGTQLTLFLLYLILCIENNYNRKIETRHNRSEDEKIFAHILRVECTWRTYMEAMEFRMWDALKLRIWFDIAISKCHEIFRPVSEKHTPMVNFGLINNLLRKCNVFWCSNPFHSFI